MKRGIERRVDRGRWRGGVGSEEGGVKRELERRRGCFFFQKSMMVGGDGD